MKKRRRKQGIAAEGGSLDRKDPSKKEKFGTMLVFKEGTAAIAGRWTPGSDGEKPAAPEQQP